MIRLYSLGLLLPLSIPALAQQTEPLIPRRVGVEVRPDSLPSINYPILSGILSYSIAGVPIKPYHFTPFFPIQEQLRQVAGVQATPYSGAPGAQVAVRIRGAASLASNAQPLYVVDGVPVFQHTFRSEVRDGQLINIVPAEVQELDVNPLLSIPSEDIEQVEVLKGAYETALYGSQGLNGVIRITTRRGNAYQPLRLRYTGYGGVQQARNRYELLNAGEYAALRNEVAERAGQPAPYTPAQLAALGRGTDWQNELLRTAAVQEHHLGLSGSAATTRYYAAADYLGQQGVVLNSRLRRYAARAALNQRIGQHLRLEATGSFARTEQRVPAYYALQNALLTPPTQSITDTPRPGYYLNPLDLARQNYQAPAQQRLLAQLGARYELTTWLTLDVRASLEQATLRSRSYQPSFGTPMGSMQGQLDATYRQWVLNPALSYTRVFNGDQHAVTARLQAMRQTQRTASEQSSQLVGQPAGLGSSGSIAQAGQTFYQLTADYTFAGRYQVQGTLRRDGSSSFALDERWSWLPGAQVRWHAAKEAFWTSAPGTLDVWVGWGCTSGAGNYGRNSALVPAPILGQPTQLLAVLVPEQTQQVDAGIEASLFNGRLTVTTQAYARRTSSTTYTPGRLTSPGIAQDAHVRNTGLELTLQSNWQAGQLQGSSRLAAAANRNQFEAATLTPSFTPYHRLLSGQPLGTFYGYRMQGLDVTGSPRYEDVNGNGISPADDQQPLGSGLPQQLLSFSQQFTLGRFEVQLQADGMFGYQVQNTSLQFLDATSGFTNASTRVLSRWTPANPATEVPVAGTNLPVFSSYTLQSGNHVRLSALTVEYTLWEKAGRSAHLWLGGQNLLVLTRYRGFDPNVSSAGSDNQQSGLDAGAYPVARTLLLGVRATL